MAGRAFGPDHRALEDDADEEDDQRQFIAEFVEGLPKMEEGAKTDDTGYESTQSKEQTPEREIQSSGRREGRPVAADI